ncbi:hypothetical protein N646_0790 [Vibrio alginolyticus NBRC 15630 = ATCC 17749]|uniref:Uncharacterized protein n=1 Tax=Vibrio alginolyticus (strain ATCC 17749 / DSM 2171 / NBRC 15630 / NCIMB 1903 / NCTC 12160 / XII-53) TaxID=1219076 RepID=A0A2I3C4X5_VIBAX|nr:hypothetical protein N646_0790 [Vibrio alginolyticus NBRC 15630 = ATCC 17749]
MRYIEGMMQPNRFLKRENKNKIILRFIWCSLQNAKLLNFRQLLIDFCF